MAAILINQPITMAIQYNALCLYVQAYLLDIFRWCGGHTVHTFREDITTLSTKSMYSNTRAIIIVCCYGSHKCQYGIRGDNGKQGTATHVM